MDTPVGVYIEEYMILRRSLRRGSTTEALKMVLVGAIVEDKNRWRKMEKGNGEEAGLSVLSTYTQLKNGLGLRLRYLEAL